MSRWQQDAVDFACEAWASQWINLFARQPIKGSELLGRVGSTLDLVKVMGDGAGAAGNLMQIYPECFMGMGLVVACTLKTMSDRQREIVWRHYVDRWYFVRIVPVKTPDDREIYEHTTVEPRAHPKSGAVMMVRIVDRQRPKTHALIERRWRPVKQEIVAERMGISKARYYQLRDRAKARLMKVVDPLDSKVGDDSPVFA